MALVTTEKVFATCTLGGAQKFWQAELKVDRSPEAVWPRGTVTLTWGRIGSAGQTKVKEFSLRSAARKFMATKIAEKNAKGYVWGNADARPPALPPPAPPARVARPALVAQATSNLERLRAQLAAMSPDQRAATLSARAKKAVLTRREKLFAARAALAAQQEAERLAQAEKQAADRRAWERARARPVAPAAPPPRYVAPPPPPPPPVAAFELPFGEEREIILRRRTT